MSTAGNSDIYIPVLSKRMRIVAPSGRGMSNFLLKHMNQILLMCALEKKIQELEKIKK
jgi:hypothetical protein